MDNKPIGIFIIFLGISILFPQLQIALPIGEYFIHKIFDCIIFNECPETINSQPRPVIQRPPAEQALRDYYRNINNNNYQKGWNSLSPHLQQNRKPHPQGYNSYTNWWTKVKRVDVLSTNRISGNPYYSTVDARLRYLMLQSGQEIYQTLRFNLIWDTNTNCWLINNVEHL
ncbi:MAG: hypothetical protein QNJ74_24595 [Trichodesmium sp. MO_231.B1]|nr:hypothetical protein [Trichodesmium sp. MO_231.B1]